ncbi:HEAT repeat domain-containing protein [Tautonia marina]|uniref:HEAT repeat domain-containing protein n=1 Tax=Tautonia marina TaxID=2653855 RepID=UPI0012610A9E|nr:HEAT repeat domain-containing protein [Tautonia marina]
MTNRIPTPPRILPCLILFACVYSPVSAGPPMQDNDDEIQTLRALIVVDTRADPPLPGIGNNYANILHTLQQANGYTGRVEIDFLDPDEVSPQAITDYFRGLAEISKDDALLFYYAGHGGTLPRAGPFLQTSGGRLLRSDLIGAMQTHSPSLIVVLTDSCSAAPRILPPIPVAPARANLVLKDLFFRHKGIVDINASSFDRERGSGEYAWYIEEKGGLFTDALVEAIYSDYDGLDADSNQFVSWAEILEKTREITRLNYQNLREMHRRFDEELLFPGQRATRDRLIAQPTQTPQAFDLGRPIPDLPPALADRVPPSPPPTLEALGLDVRENYGYGLVVSGVRGWAAEQDSGIRPGDVVFRINDQDVDGFETAHRAISKVPLGAAIVLEGYSTSSDPVKHARFILGGSDEDRVRSALTAALGAREVRVRVAAADSFARIGQPGEAAVAALGRLFEVDIQARKAAGSALAVAGPEGIAVLGRAAASPDTDLRFTAHSSLLRIGASDRHAVQALVDALESPSREVRMDAMVSLGQLRIWTALVYNALEPIARGRDGEQGAGIEQTQALITLYHLGSQLDEELLSQLLTSVRSGNMPTRLSAIQTLGRARPAADEVVRALAEQIDDESQEVRESALLSLARIEVLEPIIAALEDERPAVRRSAVSALHMIGPHAEQMSDQLVRVIKDPEVQVRQAAVLALWALGPAAADTVPELVNLLADEDPAIRYEAVVALGQIGPRAEAAVPGLIDALNDEDPSVREAAAETLSSMGPRAKPAVPRLEQLLVEDGMESAVKAIASIQGVGYLIPLSKRTSDATRAAICRGVGNPFFFLPGEVVPYLASALHDPGEETRHAAASSLNWQMSTGRLGTNLPDTKAAMDDIFRHLEGETDPSLIVPCISILDRFNGRRQHAVERLVEYLGAEQPEIRTQAANTLEEFGMEARAAVPTLILRLRDEVASVRVAAAYALSSIGRAARAAIPDLVGLLDDPEEKVWRSAIESLASLGAIPELIAILERGDAEERAAAARSMTTHRARPAIPALVRALEGDDSPEVREAAALALGKSSMMDFDFFLEAQLSTPAAAPPRLESVEVP